MLSSEINLIDTPFGHAVPPAIHHDSHHSITLHIPGWSAILKLVEDKPKFFSAVASAYPRIIQHRDVKKLNATLLDYTKAEGLYCHVFPRKEVAQACKDFAISLSERDGQTSLSSNEVQIRSFSCGFRIWAVFFPVDRITLFTPFWVTTGAGISSYIAEECLRRVYILQEVYEWDVQEQRQDAPSHIALQERIATLLEHAPVGPARQSKVSPKDVFLFQTGMSAIYYVHTYLLCLNQFPSKPLLFGFPFQSTPDVFRLFGPGLKWFPLGTEIDELDTHLISERSQGRRVPAVWTEFPSNPLLVSSDLHRLRALANEHEFLLIVDDTVGSFCNIDVLPVADIVVTSLTKSFSGYADVLGGSAVLNPNSRHYPILQGLFQRHYHNDLHPLDATVLLNNSDDYLKRSAILNRNAQSLISLLHTNFTTSSTTPIKSLYHPSLPPTSQNYTTFLRPATPDFPSPGYGCLFSIEFTSLPALIAFLDNLHVHQGPHLGAHRTLALPYVKAIFNDKMDEYEKYGVNERMLRISAGLEDDAELHRAFTFALEKAEEAVRTGKPVGKSVGDVERDGLDGSVEGGSMKGDSMLVAGDEVDVVNVT